MSKPYKICLAGYGPILPSLAGIIGADYTSGFFETAEERFHSTGEDILEWTLRGKLGSLVITLERYEGYYFSRFEALEPQFQAGKELLWKAYLAQGGNPDAQEKP